MITRKAPAAKQAPQAVIAGEAIKNFEKIAEKREDKRFLAISLQTYVSAMSSSLMSAKNAILLETALGLACMEENGGTNKDAKRALSVIYSQGGWNNLNPKDEDYTTVNRHINAICSFYDWLDKGEISRWTEGRTEMHAINAIVSELEQFNLRGINSLLSYAGKHPAKKAKEKAAQAQAQAKEQPKAEEKKPEEQPAKEGPKANWSGTTHAEIEQANVTQLRRRTEDVAEEGTLFIMTQHLKIAIPPATTKEEMLQAAQELLMRASTMDEIIEDSPQEMVEELQEELPGDDIGNKEPPKPAAAPVDPAKLAALVTARQQGRRIK